MFKLRKEKSYEGLVFSLLHGSDLWAVAYNFKKGKKIMKTFNCYKEAIKFYNRIEKNYEVTNV